MPIRRDVLVVGHDHVAGLGHLGAELERRGARLSWMTVVPQDRFEEPDVDVVYPDPAAWDGIVTTGAPWPRAATASWWPREVEFLRRAHMDGVPVLGICFGGQLLAEALGGGTRELDADRIGWYEVDSHEELLDVGPWFGWHAEQLLAPPDAAVLADSDDGCEAFALKRSIGLQFHPEMDADLLERWATLPGQGVCLFDRLRAETSAVDAAALRRRVNRLVDLLVDRTFAG